MTKYRKKPVEIEAIQFNGKNGEEIEEFTNCAARLLGSHTPLMKIATLEGDHNVRTGDWIIRGVKGEFYPCKPDIFAATYDTVEETDSEYYTEQEVSDMGIIGDNFREYLYGWNDAVVPGKGFLKRYVDMYLTHIGR